MVVILWTEDHSFVFSLEKIVMSLYFFESRVFYHARYTHDVIACVMAMKGHHMPNVSKRS